MEEKIQELLDSSAEVRELAALSVARDDEYSNLKRLLDRSYSILLESTGLAGKAEKEAKKSGNYKAAFDWRKARDQLEFDYYIVRLYTLERDAERNMRTVVTATPLLDVLHAMLTVNAINREAYTLSVTFIDSEEASNIAHTILEYNNASRAIFALRVLEAFGDVAETERYLDGIKSFANEAREQVKYSDVAFLHSVMRKVYDIEKIAYKNLGEVLKDTGLRMQWD